MSKKHISKITSNLFYAALAVFFIWLSLRHLNADQWTDIQAALRNTRFTLIVPVIGILFLSHWVRALRWRLLIGSLGHTVSKRDTFYAVMIGYLVNQGVPRLGEVMKCTLLGRKAGIPVEKLIGTILLERLFDACCLLVFFGITLAIQPDLYGKLMTTFFESGQSVSTKKDSSGLWIISLVLIGLGILAWWKLRHMKVEELKNRLRRFQRQFVEGLRSIQHLKARGYFLFLTLVMWSCYLGGGYIGLLAFSDTQSLGLPVACSILSAGSVGMIASPGGIGAYAYLIQKTMELYGLKEAAAIAFGWLLWLAQTGVVIVGGLASFAGISIKNRTDETA
ncbi:MAG: lysylphosphatidylglycerol synthase transmembrane domain-containing protein [Bacteroidota bacterium]